MYETSFKFRSRPFPPTPQTGTYFPAAAIERALQTASRLIDRGDGPGLITGPPGTGKSLLCQLLAEKFQDRFAVVLLSSGRLKTCRALLQTILYALALPYRDLSEGDLRLTLLDFLEPKSGGTQGLLLLIDEAHTLPWRLLDEVRLMTNLVRDGQPRVRVILAGAAVLEERFASPKLVSFNQRLAGRCYLEPLDRRETFDYVRAQISVAGGEAELLVDDAALASVYRATDGVPRLINQVCDHALILASLGGQRRLSNEAIEEAWADLQQLPPPWTPPVEGQGAPSHIVEFGSLDDESEEAPEAIPFRGVTKQTLAMPRAACTPDDQLEAIADQLLTIEEDDDQQGVAGTETVLDFPEFGDPFEENFAEEEVVIDPFGSDVEILADVPRVSSWESRQLSSLLDQAQAAQPWVKSQPRGDVRINEPSGARGEASAPFVPASDPVLPDDAPGDLVPREDHADATDPQPLDQLTGVANDRDLIVLEDDAPASGVIGSAPLPARKPEFRQLFAKLRRG